MDPELFNNDFFDPLLSKLNHECNKSLYIAGDFNFDLLKCTSNKETAHFYNRLSTNLLLPMITLPTKINTKTDTPY